MVLIRFSKQQLPPSQECSCSAGFSVHSSSDTLRHPSVCCQVSQELHPVDSDGPDRIVLDPPQWPDEALCSSIYLSIYVDSVINRRRINTVNRWSDGSTGLCWWEKTRTVSHNFSSTSNSGGSNSNRVNLYLVTFLHWLFSTLTQRFLCLLQMFTFSLIITDFLTSHWRRNCLRITEFSVCLRCQILNQQQTTLLID